MRERVMLGATLNLAAILFLTACSGTDVSRDPVAEETDSAFGSAQSAMTEAALVSGSAGRATGPVKLDSYATLAASATGCTNRGGPEIKIYGDIVLGSFGANITAANNLKRTHQATQETSAFIALHSDKDVIKVDKGGKYGVSGNPDMYLELFDHADNSLGKVYLGRCNRPLPPQKIDFTILSDIELHAVQGDCSGRGGPEITLTGALVLQSLKANLILQKRNGKNPVETPVAFAISLLAPGETLVFNKPPPRYGVGGNPWFWVALTDHADRPISEEILLGRCNDF